MLGVGDDDIHVVDDCQARVALGEEGCQPHVALVVEDFHCRHALDELDVLGELEEELVELQEELENLMMHASLKSPFLNFFVKCFFLFSSLSASVGYGST